MILYDAQCAKPRDVFLWLVENDRIYDGFKARARVFRYLSRRAFKNKTDWRRYCAARRNRRKKNT